MTPIWRQAFNAWEKAASPVLQQTATSPAFRDFMRVGTRINKSIAAEFEQASRQWLHAMNLPAATDLHRLRSQVRELEKELQGVRQAVETRPTVQEPVQPESARDEIVRDENGEIDWHAELIA